MQRRARAPAADLCSLLLLTRLEVFAHKGVFPGMQGLVWVIFSLSVVENVGLSNPTAK